MVYGPSTMDSRQLKKAYLCTRYDVNRFAGDAMGKGLQ